jgi:glyoxylase-like metal-dependent hydrolase (beta-lactamase superfamily II)
MRMVQRAAEMPTVHDVTCVPLTLVGLLQLTNVYLIDVPDGGWVLVDAGVPGSGNLIRRAARVKFGADAPPRAIILTHAHFDHIGAIHALLNRWRVQVFAHHLEMPYLLGREVLPPLDPTVGGMTANIARLFPSSGTDISASVEPLPPDGRVPFLPNWRWLHTPGHTPGHISLWQAEDRILLAGDAVTTMNQERPGMAISAAPQINGPPTYATSDWEAAERSVQLLANLDPRILAAGHGRPIGGPGVSVGLRELAEHFAEWAVPRHGRYVAAPARFDPATGATLSLPPAPPDPVPAVLGAATLVGAGIAGAMILRRSQRHAGNRSATQAPPRRTQIAS